MKVLCTFSGHYGDILWSLPTARELAKRHGGKVDFAVMTAFASLVPLLESQSYIGKAFGIDEWKLENECFGCQPWQSPNFNGRDQYERVYDLTYKMHPHSMRLAEWTARQTAEVALPNLWVPFIEVQAHAPVKNTVAYNFNPMYGDIKSGFLHGLKTALPKLEFVETGKLSWIDAASLLEDAICFVGCRSSNYALAHGVGGKVLILEPHPMRGSPVFDFPFGPTPEVEVSRMLLENQISFAASKIQQWVDEKEEHDGEYSAAKTRRAVRPARDSENQGSVLRGKEADKTEDAVRERGAANTGVSES